MNLETKKKPLLSRDVTFRMAPEMHEEILAILRMEGDTISAFLRRCTAEKINSNKAKEASNYDQENATRAS